MEYPWEVYERSPYKIDLPYDQLSPTSDALKGIREKFVTGFSGSTKYESLSIVMAAPFALYLHHVTLGYLTKRYVFWRRLRNCRSDDSLPEGLTKLEHLFNLCVDILFSFVPCMVVSFYPDLLHPFFIAVALVWLLFFFICPR